MFHMHLTAYPQVACDTRATAPGRTGPAGAATGFQPPPDHPRRRRRRRQDGSFGVATYMRATFLCDHSTMECRHTQTHFSSTCPTRISPHFSSVSLWSVMPPRQGGGERNQWPQRLVWISRPHLVWISRPDVTRAVPAFDSNREHLNRIGAAFEQLRGRI